MAHPDLSIIRQALKTFRPGPEHVLELRALKVGAHKYTLNGFFDDAHLAEMARAALELSSTAEGVYFTLNAVRSDLLARAANRIAERPVAGTQDSDIARRRWLPLDFDPKRPTSISATAMQKEVAHERCRECVAHLADRGWPAPIIADSGNGYHALYRIDLPNDEASRKLVERTLKALSALFSDDLVVLDASLFNAARIIKLYGTVSRKGDDLPVRPHRLSALIEVPA